MIGYIYIITCLVTGLVYIGQTRRTPKVRFDSHKQRADQHARDVEAFKQNGTPVPSTCWKLYRAMNAHGKENFKMEVLEEVHGYWLEDLKENLNLAEEYYIAQYDAVNTGMNIKPGGDSCFHTLEMRAKMSVSMRARVARGTDEFRTHEEAMGLPNYITYKSTRKRYVYRNRNLPGDDAKGMRSFSKNAYGSLDAAKQAAIACAKYVDEHGKLPAKQVTNARRPVKNQNN